MSVTKWTLTKWSHVTSAGNPSIDTMLLRNISEKRMEILRENSNIIAAIAICLFRKTFPTLLCLYAFVRNLFFNRSENRRQRHQNVEHLNMSYPCEICGKTFPVKVFLTRHLDRVHDKEKRKVQCSICQKWLSCKETLDSHVRTHTGEKPYK